MAELEAELALYDAVTGRVSVSRGRYPPPELVQLWEAVRYFVSEDVPGVDVVRGDAGEAGPDQPRLRNVDASVVVSAAAEPASADNPYLDTGGRLRLLSVRQVCTAFAMLRHLARGPQLAGPRSAPREESAETPAAASAPAAAPRHAAHGTEQGHEAGTAAEGPHRAVDADEGAAGAAPAPPTPSGNGSPPRPAPEGMTPEQVRPGPTSAPLMEARDRNRRRGRCGR